MSHWFEKEVHAVHSSKVFRFLDRWAVPTIIAVFLRQIVQSVGRLFIVGVASAAVIGVAASSTAPQSSFGLDFGWGGPSVSAMHSAGAKFGASYLSYDSSKNWQAWQVRAYHAAGIATVNVWETTADRALQGFAAGRSDAHAARQQASALGEPTNRPIYFAIDCDCSGGSVASYFDGVDSVLGVSLTGDYGGYYPTKYLFDTHRIAYGWQTYAWSGGQWDPRAQLRQYSNGHTIGGRDTDYDEGVKADYGQYGGPVPPAPKPVDVNHFSWYPTTLEWFSVHDAKHSFTHTFNERHIIEVAVHRKYHDKLLRQELLHAAHVIRAAAYSEPTSPAGFGISRPSWNIRHRLFRYHRLHANALR